MITRLIVFTLINFAGLALGSIYTNTGVNSEWYANLNKAPWTPPGWVFGAAWTSIMICFSVYLSLLWEKLDNKSNFLILFGILWLLNVIWNPLFFYFHQTSIALVCILTLTLLLAYFTGLFAPKLKLISLLNLPYLLWLLIATSLNAFIVVRN